MSVRLPAAPNHDTFASQDKAAGLISTTLFRFFSDLIAFLNNRISVDGAASFTGGTTAAVTFATAEPNASYQIYPSSPDGKIYWATGKTTSGFTMNSSSAVTADVAYQLKRA